MHKPLNKRRKALLIAGGALLLMIAVGMALGWPQLLYDWCYDALAFAPQAVVEAIKGTHGHGQVIGWSAWMRDPVSRFRLLHGAGHGGLDQVILLELAIVLIVPAVVTWRIVWFFVTRMGEVAPGDPHGSARWMTAQEARSLAYSHGSLLLGEMPGGRLIGLDITRQSMNTLLIGPPGSGKSSGIIIPNLLREDGRRSIVITDLKGELRETCAGHLARTHEVWVVDFLNPGVSLGYNPLASCTDEMSSALFCNAWIANTGTSQSEPFWDNATRELLMAGIAHLRSVRPDATLAHLNALLCYRAPDQVISEFERSASPIARMKAVSFLGALRRNDRLLGSVFAEITPRFLVMADPRVQSTTSVAEIDFSRLVSPLGKPVALFISLDRTLQEELKPLVASFFLDLFRTLSQVADRQPDGRLERPVFFYGDEFGNLGAIPKMPIWTSTLRSAGVGMLLALQTAAQGLAIYGREGMDTIRASCATKLGLSGMDSQDARWFSDLAGQTTVVQTSASQQRGRFHVMTERGSKSESESARALMTADEVRRLRPEEVLAVVGELQPVRLQQRRWYRDGQVKNLAQKGFNPRRTQPLVPPQVQIDLGVTQVVLDDDAANRPRDIVPTAGASGQVEVEAGQGQTPTLSVPVRPVEPDMIGH